MPLSQLGTWLGLWGHCSLLYTWLWRRRLLHTGLLGDRVGWWLRELPHRHLCVHLVDLHPFLICNNRRRQQSSTYLHLSRRQCSYWNPTAKEKSLDHRIKNIYIGLTCKGTVTFRLSCKQLKSLSFTHSGSSQSFAAAPKQRSMHLKTLLPSLVTDRHSQPELLCSFLDTLYAEGSEALPRESLVPHS